MSIKDSIKTFVSRFTYMVILAMILGLFTDGYPPAYSTEISTGLLMIVMTLSLASLKLRDINFRAELKHSTYVLLINFGFLSAISIVTGLVLLNINISTKIFYGFIAMAAVPPAIATIPFSKIVKGDLELATVSITFLYLSALVITPLILLLTAGQTIDIISLIQDLILLIIIPLIVSRGVRRLDLSSETLSIASNIVFFLLVFGIMGNNRGFIFSNLSLIPILALGLFLRTFGSGGIVLWLTQKRGVSKAKSLTYSLFAANKNEGLAIILALSLFCCEATLPAIIAIIFEILWVSYLELIHRK